MLRDIALLMIGAALGWAVPHFLPRLWRRTGWESPVDVHVETDPRIFEAGLPDWIGYSFVIPGRIPADMPAQPANITAQDWWAWARDMGGYDGWSTKVVVTLTSRSNALVVVDALSVRVTSREPVPEGVLIGRLTGGASIALRGIEVDLDKWGQHAATRYRGAGGGDVASLSLSLAPGDVEKLQIEARAEHALCAWTAELHLLVDGHRRTVTIDNDGEPFVTAAEAGRTMHLWQGGAWRARLES